MDKLRKIVTINHPMRVIKRILSLAMLAIYLLAIFTAFMILQYMFTKDPSYRNNQLTIVSCGPGHYDAGGVCRSEPTGCPYGDTLPLDDPRCAPPKYNDEDFPVTLITPGGK